MTETEVIIFLLAVMCILAVMVGVIAWNTYTDSADDINEILDDYEELQTDHANLQAERAKLEQQYMQLSDRNEELAEFVQSLNKENRELFRELSELKNTRECSENEHSAAITPADRYERLPENIDTNRYDCMGYSFPDGTDQARLQRECCTDPDTGIRYWRDIDGKMYCCAAMGGAYGCEIGRCFNVTLECGTTFGVIMAEFQHDITQPDPDDFGEIWLRDEYGNKIERLRNYDGELVCHVLEFVCDMQRIPSAVLDAGTMSVLLKFGGLYGDGGNIVKIEHLGRRWEP